MASGGMEKWFRLEAAGIIPAGQVGNLSPQHDSIRTLVTHRIHDSALSRGKSGARARDLPVTILSTVRPVVNVGGGYSKPGGAHRHAYGCVVPVGGRTTGDIGRRKGRGFEGRDPQCSKTDSEARMPASAAVNRTPPRYERQPEAATV